ncbi:GRIN2-like protein [Triplophysa rosa]|uniref:GRIN2-like protein n=1 Tax=Triplophysa rosa TaxID=992332 RepID=A0A9W7WP03_TRIRA|nr:GRIN2-like protein [Triplophysa rosa]XP_057197763.1 GRIN2-like protein [Triplophysa rosa]KAI7805670.1 putative GRIN2-like protein [Triplophysa rosa]
MERFSPGVTIPSNPAECVASDPISAEVKVFHQPEEQLKSSSEISCSPKNIKDSEQTAALTCNINSDHVTDQQHTGHHYIAETHVSDGADLQLKDIMNHHNKQACGGLLSVHRDHVLYPHRDLKEHSLLSIQRSQSDSLQIYEDGQAPSRNCDAGSFCYPIKEQETCAQSFPSLVCKQAMPLQQSNTVTTSTRTGSSRSGSPTQPSQQTFVQTGASSQIQVPSEAIPESSCSKFHDAVCCNLHFHHGAVEDTFAAYCHPQPIPAPAQLLPHLVGMEGNHRAQVASGNSLALPRLISSVSETGLNAKRLFHCCDLDCSWPGPLRPTRTQMRQWKDGETTREAATMTSQKELRDIGVQVGQDSEEYPEHVFPEVCLLEEKVNGSDKTAPKSQKSPVRDVKWDAEGMTWEVYGASVDPEELGIAIQQHLELQIKETMGIAAKLSRQNTATSQHSSGSTHGNKRRLLKSLRRPGCCTSTTTAVD